MTRSFGGNPVVTVGAESVKVGLRLEGEAPEGSLSGLYFTLHLPQRADPAKLTLELERCEVPVQVTVLYDGPDRTARGEVLATAGASAYAVEAVASIGGVPMDRIIGQTGTTLSLPVTW